MGQCVAHISTPGPRHGERCQRAAKNGTTVCGAHGAKAPQVKLAAERRWAGQQAEQKARDEVARQGVVVPDNLNPLDVLDDLLAEVVQVKNYLGNLARKLADNDLRYAGRSGEQLRGEWQLYSTMLRDCQRFAESMVKLNLDQRRISLLTEQANMLLHVLKLVFDDIGLSDEQKRIATSSVARRLREVDGSAIEAIAPEPYVSPRKARPA